MVGTFYDSTDGEREVHHPDDESIAGEWAVRMMDGAALDTNAVALGYTGGTRQKEPLMLQNESLYRHALVVGPTGFGKTTLLHNTLRQVATAGDGFCYVTARSDDVTSLLRRIPEDRMDDVVLVGVYNDDVYSVDAFAASNDEERDDITAHFADSITNEEDTEGLKADVHRTVRTLVSDESQYAPTDFRRLLSDRTARLTFQKNHGNDLLDTLTDNTELERRLVPYADRRVSGIFNDDKEATTLGDAVRDDKLVIVSCDVASQKCREVIAGLATQRVWAALKHREERDSFFLAFDEFDDIANRIDIGRILSKARAARCSVWVSLQALSALPKKPREQVSANTDNVFAFRPAYEELPHIGKLFGKQTIETLRVLPRHVSGSKVVMPDGEVAEFAFGTFPAYPAERSAEAVGERF